MVLPDYVDQEFLRHLVLATPDPLFLCDEAGNIVLANEHALRAFGYELGELLGRSVEVLVPERFRPDHPQQRARYMANPAVRPMGQRRSLSAVHKNGREIPVEISLSTFTAGEKKYVLAAIRDVTEQRRMEAFIQDGNLILSRVAAGAPLAEALPMIVVFVERSGEKIRCAILRHETAKRAFVVEAAPSMPAEYVRKIESRRIDPGSGLWCEAAFYGESLIVTDVTAAAYRTEFAESAPAQTRACWSEPILDSQGELLGTFVVYGEEPREPSPREIEVLSLAAHMAGIGMERDRRGKQLQEQEQQLRRKHRLEAVGSLTGGIAHEFNNLLQTITAYTDFALSAIDPADPVQRDLTTVRTAAGRATALTRQLLSFCRQHPMDRRQLDLNALVDETCTMLRPLIGANIEFRILRATEKPEVAGDFGQLQQALINLCLNARDAMPEGGTLTISTRAATAACGRPECVGVRAPAVLTVQDTGCGMTPEIKERIFDPFFTTKELGRGTGLGLPAVHGIVEQHGGGIEIESAPGRGTTVRILLPPDGGKIVAAAEDVVSARIPLAGGTILVAEDDEAVRIALQRILESAGYTVLLAGDGEEAVQLFESRRGSIDLAMFDVIMPKRGGRWAAARLLEARPDLPIVFCTGYDPDADAAAWNEFPNATMLVKPVEAEHLLKCIRTKLEQLRQA